MPDTLGDSTFVDGDSKEHVVQIKLTGEQDNGGDQCVVPAKPGTSAYNEATSEDRINDFLAQYYSETSLSVGQCEFNLPPTPGGESNKIVTNNQGVLMWYNTPKNTYTPTDITILSGQALITIRGGSGHLAYVFDWELSFADDGVEDDNGDLGNVFVKVINQEDSTDIYLVSVSGKTLVQAPNGEVITIDSDTGVMIKTDLGVVNKCEYKNKKCLFGKSTEEVSRYRHANEEGCNATGNLGGSEVVGVILASILARQSINGVQRFIYNFKKKTMKILGIQDSDE